MTTRAKAKKAFIDVRAREAIKTEEVASRKVAEESKKDIVLKAEEKKNNYGKMDENLAPSVVKADNIAEKTNSNLRRVILRQRKKNQIWVIQKKMSLGFNPEDIFCKHTCEDTESIAVAGSGDSGVKDESIHDDNT